MIATRTATVLVVDDELVVRRTLVRAITRAGYSCTAVSDAAEAMGCFAEGETRPELVICDLYLPGESGVQLAHRLATIAPGVPVLITSGASPETVAGDPHIAGFLEKPFELAMLTSAIADALRDRKVV
ncbi:MAG: response regulator [Polyangia bacterium]